MCLGLRVEGVASAGGCMLQLRTGICLSPIPARVDASATPHWYLLAGCSPGWLHVASPQWYRLVSAA